MEKQKNLFGKTEAEINDALNKASTFPEKWNFEANKRFIGKLLKRETAVIDGDNREYVVMLDDKTKEWTVWLGTVLKNKFESQKIALNDVLVIDYLGKEKSSNKKYNDYANYNVAKL